MFSYLDSELSATTSHSAETVESALPGAPSAASATDTPSANEPLGPSREAVPVRERAERAVDFLLDFTRNEPVHLVFFGSETEGPPKGPLLLTPSTRQVVIKRLVNAEKAGWNAYWAVNRVREGFGKPKAARGDIAHIRAVYADLDPDDTLPLETARAKLRDVLGSLPLDLMPTAIIDSGNGYQAFWRLEAPISAPDNMERAEALGKAFAQGLRGDHVWDICRIMRVPFMQNFPNKKKKDNGRKPRLAGIYRETGPDYTLDGLEAQVSALSSSDTGKYTEGGRAASAKPARPAYPLDRAFEPLPESVRADMMRLLPDFTTPGDFSALWQGDYAQAKNNKGEFFTDRSDAVFSLLLQIVLKLPGEMTVARLRAVAEQSSMIADVYADKWNRDAKFADDECKKAIDAAAKYRHESARRTVAKFEAVKGESDTVAPNTDVANRNRLMKEFGEELKFAGKTPFMWDGKRWEQSAVERAKARCHVLSKLIAREITDQGKALENAISNGEREDIRKGIDKLTDAARRAESHKAIEAAHSLYRDLAQIQRSEFDRYPSLLNVQNGIVDLKTGKLEPHDRNRYLSQIASTHYDPHATAPRWEKFLREIFDGDQELIDWMQVFLGYSITGETREHIFPVFYGNGRNGKSKLTIAISEVLGDYAGTLVADILAPKKGMSEAEEERAANPLVGKRLVLAMEPSSGARLSEGLIKKWTGGDRLRARPLYSESFEFDPTHQLILCTNHKPTVSNQDDGVWGRLRLIPFNQKFEGKKKDPAISEKLREQYPGILRWLVEGATRYYEFGLSDVPKAIGEATDAYRAHEDICSQFVEECLDVTDPTASTPFQEVYATYNRWCVAHGRRPLSDRTWGGELDRVLGRGRVKKKTGMVCEGVKLRPNQGRGGFTDATDAALF